MITILTYGKSKRDEYPKTDIVISCLGLDNPPHVLWDLDGRSPEIRIYIADQVVRDKKKGNWFEKVTAHVLKRAKQKEDLSIGFFCQGGRHRSVSVAELVAQMLRNNSHDTDVIHMELNAQ